MLVCIVFICLVFVGKLVEQRWIFIAYCVETRQGVLREIPNKRAATLFPLVKDVVRAGSIITAGGLKSYYGLQSDYDLLRVNHSLNYADPVTGALTNHVEAP